MAEEDKEKKEEKTDVAAEQMLRIRADFENTKKRLEREKESAIRFANERLLAEILPIVDNFDRAMTSLSEGHDPEKVKQGLKIAQDELHQVLEEHGVEVVKSVGESFDPHVHEAVATVPSAGARDGTIVDEIQRGYLLNGRLLRPSRVRIAQNQPKNSGEEEET
ncbi:MAG: nucleotide exchange factor GrpE [Candidatus Omnitrophica bacterium]|nr:nucleotide exchange factor GrpE [Candidatus Omnitrophota bacterium]